MIVKTGSNAVYSNSDGIILVIGDGDGYDGSQWKIIRTR